tara:strand:- start:80 stop:469 length:390 start_codon:yes stop_codon:yes gene_type:complete
LCLDNNIELKILRTEDLAKRNPWTFYELPFIVQDVILVLQNSKLPLTCREIAKLVNSYSSSTERALLFIEQFVPLICTKLILGKKLYSWPSGYELKTSKMIRQQFMKNRHKRPKLIKPNISTELNLVRN